MDAKMGQRERNEPFFTVLGLLIASGSATAGWFVPEFYDWTGSDQSRAAPEVGVTAIAIAIVDLGLIASLVWSHFQSRLGKNRGNEKEPIDRGVFAGSVYRYSLGQLLWLVTGTALLLAIGSLGSPLVAAWLVFCSAIFFAVWWAMRNRSASLWMAWIFWLQMSPYLWVVREPRLFDDSLNGLNILLALPSFFPMIWLNALFGIHFESGLWINIISTSLTFALGAWIASHGRRRTIAYGLLVMTFSIFGSFMLNAAMRA